MLDYVYQKREINDGRIKLNAPRDQVTLIGGEWEKNPEQKNGIIFNQVCTVIPLCVSVEIVIQST